MGQSRDIEVEEDDDKRKLEERLLSFLILFTAVFFLIRLYSCIVLQWDRGVR